MEQDTQFAKLVTQSNIEAEMQKSYLDYAMSVIMGRALPDVRDGLKPVHRRILFAMHELSNDWNRPYKKSARIVGDVIGKYHPHGEMAVYDAIVRMAQSFSLRDTIIDGQGNFGSVDGDPAAAMRYTEIRMSKIGHELLTDLDKETVDFVPNYDGNEREPVVLPARFPNLLVNGTTGIAVGMATSIPPHNLSEIIDGTLALLANNEITVEELTDIIPAPDFPTAGIIFGVRDIKQGYKTGQGRVLMRARTHFEDLSRDKQAIIVDELPYQVNKAKLCERIAELIKDKIVDGITEVRDESDKSGMRVVIELRRNENANVILNNLFKLTQMQDSFGINMVALVNGQPKLLNLKLIILEFIAHRREIVTRRTIFDLNKARDRGHILEGLAVALHNVDEIIAIIKQSKTPAEAKAVLLSKVWHSELVASLLGESSYRLSEIQAQAILDLRLQRLTALEQDKIIQEYQEIMQLIAELDSILNSTEKINKIIAEELQLIKEQFGTPRKSEITLADEEILHEDLIPPRDMIVTLSHEGYVKTQALTDYRIQHRGGRGKIATTMREHDFVQMIFSVHSHDYVLCFSNLGRLYWLKVYNIPEGSRTNRGRPIINLLNLKPEEKITNIIPVTTFTDDRFIIMVTKCGVIKKVKLSAFAHPSNRGVIAINLDDNDILVGTAITDGKQEIMIFADNGKAVRFNESQIRDVGRAARGVRGIRLQQDAAVVALLTTDNLNAQVLTITQQGFGKRTEVEEYRLTSRAAQGVIAMRLSANNGRLVTAQLVDDDSEIMLITAGGILIRTKANSIRKTGRSAKGVKLIDLNNDTLVDAAIVVEKEENSLIADENSDN